MAAQIQKEVKRLPDEVLAELWTMMHLAAQSDIELDRPQHEFSALPKGSILFTAECDTEDLDDGNELESDSPSDGNANENTTDIENMRRAGETLAVIGDCYDAKPEHDQLVEELAQCLEVRSKRIDRELAAKLLSPTPVDVFKHEIVSAAYKEFSSYIQKFLVGENGLTKMALVTHVTRGVSMALRSESTAVGLASALAFKLVSDKLADDIMEAGGLHKMVEERSQSQEKKERDESTK